MAKTNAQIASVIATYTPQTDADVLTLYRLFRDQLVVKAFDDEQAVKVHVRGREVELANPITALAFVERTIAYYEQKTNSEAKGMARTYANIRRSG
jgi:hypothetical protein|tara:strand:- start:208 stop:495 length:288 start_codon:yes stop_codon:yes gene_type:complete